MIRISPFKHFAFKIFPHPLVSFIVFCSWLMLQHSLSLGNILLALFFCWAIPKWVQNFVVVAPNIVWSIAFKLFLTVVWDVITSNIRVARLILGPSDRLHPKWFRVPLETNHDQVNTLLAMIITTTPGTVSAGIDHERGDILVHSLDTTDDQADIHEIKQRYEKPLIAIFHAMDAIKPEYQKDTTEETQT